MFGLSTIKLVAYALAALVLFGAGYRLAYKIDQGKYETLVATVAQATVKAQAEAAAKQKQYDTLALSAAQSDRDEQAARATQAEAQLREVGNHVSVQTITRTCVPYGLYRVLSAASHGRLASDLPLPTGKSDAACSPVDWTALAAGVVADDYNAAANAGQLNSLTGFIRKAQAVK